MGGKDGDIFRLIENCAKKFAPGAPEDTPEIIREILPDLTKLGTDEGYAAAVAVEEDGFLTVGNFPFPVKGELPVMGPAGIFAISVLAGMAMPVLTKINADQVEITNNLRQLVAMMQSYRLDKGRYPASPAEVEEFSDDSELFQSRSFDDVEFLEPNQGIRVGRNIVAHQEISKLEQVVVLLKDGSVESQKTEAFNEGLQKQSDK